VEDDILIKLEKHKISKGRAYNIKRFYCLDSFNDVLKVINKNKRLIIGANNALMGKNPNQASKILKEEYPIIFQWFKRLGSDTSYRHFNFCKKTRTRMEILKKAGFFK
jgi:hypothetical protein